MMVVIYIVVGLIALFLLLSLMGPREYSVERSTVVNSEKNVVYDYIRHIRNQDDWGPWQQRDPDMKSSYSGTDGQVGFISRWSGNKQVGEGEQEILKLVDGERVETHLRFIKPFKAESDVHLQLEEEGPGQTRVTWGIVGENKTAIQRVIGLVMNMDKAMGKDFEEGLGKLKANIESQKP